MGWERHEGERSPGIATVDEVNLLGRVSRSPVLTWEWLSKRQSQQFLIFQRGTGGGGCLCPAARVLLALNERRAKSCCLHSGLRQGCVLALPLAMHEAAGTLHPWWFTARGGGSCPRTFQAPIGSSCSSFLCFFYFTFFVLWCLGIESRTSSLLRECSAT